MIPTITQRKVADTQQENESASFRQSYFKLIFLKQRQELSSFRRRMLYTNITQFSAFNATVRPSDISPTLSRPAFEAPRGTGGRSAGSLPEQRPVVEPIRANFTTWLEHLWTKPW